MKLEIKFSISYQGDFLGQIFLNGNCSISALILGPMRGQKFYILLNFQKYSPALN
jgi:hypothetical protein